ncbi:MAG TPA: UvrD-helicase domain-containing protein [Ohtaekwangia sp.]
MDKTFSIYRSSAGSGKTRTLAKEYLKLALRYPEYFRYILAMTFTNKSTQEMKDRIIRYLDDFTSGKSEDLALEIIADFQNEGRTFSTDQLRERSREVLTLVLHQYAQFSISTIDAFFQRVIRSFTRETGLLGNFRLEVENELVVEEVVGLLMDELTDNDDLRGWIMDYSLERLKDGENWDIRTTLMNFSKEIFKEEFKAIEDQVLAVTSKKEFFRNFKNTLQRETKVIENTIRKDAQRLLDEFHAQHLSVDDFWYGRAGSIYTYLEKLTRGEIELPGARVNTGLEDAEKWSGPKTDKKKMLALVQSGWQAQLATLVDYIRNNIVRYESARQALKNLYVFGLVSDISRTLKEYLSENNLMLLSDAPHFLQGVMKDQDTSFVYEKVGSFYRHFLIDEFQDTSGFQWKNLLPLIKNGLSQNYKSLIVGDIKQSIYRWRGGDLNILQEKVKGDVDESVIQTFSLDTNYRSLGNLVNFNNLVFKSASEIIGMETRTDFPVKSYTDAAQKIFRDKDRGYVNIQFVEPETEEEKERSFEELSLARIPKVFEELQLKGIPLQDIAFLVRENSEGQMIAQYFMEYGASAEANPDCRYDVVSNESLRLDQASSVLILINAMRILENPKNGIAHAHLAYEYQKLWPANTFPDHHALFTQSRTKHFAKLVPKAFTEQLEVLSAFPMIELVENLIHIFSLGKLPAEIPYLQAFEDVIFEFIVREKSDLASFLTWWEDNKHKKSIQVAGGVQASQIITIHKSKGLQFRYVIIPFLNWELNHMGTKAPILWCRSDDPLFADAGFLPIRYTSSLENTFFKDTYQQERERIFLDNLNLLYVAFTRAEEGLIAQAPAAKGKLSHVGNLVKKAIEGNIELQQFWNESDQRLMVGEVFRTAVEETQQNKALRLRQYSVTPWRDHIHVRTRGKEFFQETEQRKKINYGIFLHTLMSRIRTADDIPMVIKQSLQEGLIMNDERNQIEEAVQWIVSHPALVEAFAAEGVLKTEASLIVPAGGERRIDRIRIDNGKAILIDYKTGKPKSEDRVQVKEYIAILSGMGLSSVKGFLVYPADRNCVEV